jgi:hypothetical protein
VPQAIFGRSGKNLSLAARHPRGQDLLSPQACFPRATRTHASDRGPMHALSCCSKHFSPPLGGRCAFTLALQTELLAPPIHAKLRGTSRRWQRTSLSMNRPREHAQSLVGFGAGSTMFPVATCGDAHKIGSSSPATTCSSPPCARQGQCRHDFFAGASTNQRLLHTIRECTIPVAADLPRPCSPRLFCHKRFRQERCRAFRGKARTLLANVADSGQ